METTLSPDRTSTGIWSRVVRPEEGNLSPEAARSILELKFADEDLRRADELAEKARQGPKTVGRKRDILMGRKRDILISPG